MELLWMEMQVPPFMQCRFPQVRESFSQVAPTKPWGDKSDVGRVSISDIAAIGLVKH